MPMQHLLFAFLLLIAPAWDFYDTTRLKRSPSSQNKLRYYKTLCVWLWAASILAIALLGWRAIFLIRPTPGEIDWLLHRIWVRYIAMTLLFAIAVLLLLPGAMGLWKNLTGQPRKYSSAEALRKTLGFFLPETRVERRWFAFVCITAGICEETLFRGFLLHYLHNNPWRLSLTLALFLSAVIFGLQHLYLGGSGAVSTIFGGVIFGLIFLLSGTLLLPMIFHALLDLRTLVMLPPPVNEGR